MSKSKRFKFAIFAMIANFIIFGIGIFIGSDLTGLGTGLALINAPLYGYIFGETVRPSNTKPSKKIQLND